MIGVILTVGEPWLPIHLLFTLFWVGLIVFLLGGGRGSTGELRGARHSAGPRPHQQNRGGTADCGACFPVAMNAAFTPINPADVRNLALLRSLFTRPAIAPGEDGAAGAPALVVDETNLVRIGAASVSPQQNFPGDGSCRDQNV